jgi:osmotically-inducible protein OsmY
MKRSLLIAAVFVGAAVPSFAQADIAGMEPKSIQDVTRAMPTAQDMDLTEKVRAALQEDTQLHAMLSRIQLKTVNGVVHLKGSVDSEAEKKTVEERVKACPGVSQIENHIRVGR